MRSSRRDGLAPRRHLPPSAIDAAAAPQWRVFLLHRREYCRRGITAAVSRWLLCTTATATSRALATATRKNPSIWHRWSVEYALEMHRLQLQIAIRAVSLIKVGGLVCYSTCSLNPLENESVVAELLRRGRGSLELVDCSDRLPELNRANGLRTWTVLDDDMREHASYDELMKSDELPLAIKRRFLPSMWPPDQQQQAKPPPESTPPLRLERCLRLLPHLANMGGFFVALIRKVAPLPGPPLRATPHAEEVEPAEPPPPPPPSAGRQRLRLVPSAALSELE